MSALDKLDPTKIPLPNGTEVGTRRDLPIPNSDKFIPQGSVGRVKETRDDGRVRIAIPGRGEFIYEREDLHPRKDGQIKFAINREADWDRFYSHVIYWALVGSRAWGVSNNDSDTDIRGVFVWPFEATIGFSKPSETIQSLSNSNSYWEIEKTLQQLLKADPNTLEMLYVPEYECQDEIAQELRDNVWRFASQEIYGSFGRYALSQSKKMRQSLRLAQHRGIVLEWLRENPDLTLDQVSDKLFNATLSGTNGGFQKAKSYVKQLYISLFDQGLLGGRCFDSLKDFAKTRPDDLELPRELRPKNAYNLLRIVSSAVQWLATGEPIIKTTGMLNSKLWLIKRGEISLPRALDWVEKAAEGLDKARANSVLPEKPDYDYAVELLRTARKKMARIWVKYN